MLDIVSCWHRYDGSLRDDFDALDMFQYVKQMKTYYRKMDDILEFERAFPDVNFRYYVVPSKAYETKMMDFRAKSTSKNWELGEEDGLKIVGKGEGYMFQRLREWRSSEELMLKYKDLADYVEAVEEAEG